MLILRTIPVIFIALGVFLPSGRAQQDSSPVNVEAILRDLAKIEAKQIQDLESSRNSAISKIRAAATSPSAAKSLYKQAVEETQFAGVPGKGAAFADWKSSMSDVLRSKELEAALHLHLTYLMLSLDRGGSDEPERFVAPSLAYVLELARADQEFLDFAQDLDEAGKKNPALKQVAKLCDDLLKKSLTASPFVKWLRMESWLPKGEWELAPGNLSGILEKNVRTFMRQAADPKVVGTWEIEMKIEAARATAGGRAHDATDYNALKGPQLRFSRAKDMMVVGQKNRGATEVYALVKEFPLHPDFGTWLNALRAMLAPAAEASPAAAQP
jgi:hypothetical protein